MRKSTKWKVLACIAAAAITMTAAPANNVFAAGNVTYSDNISNNSYGMARYDYRNDVIDAYLTANDDDTITRVEHVGENVILETYDSEYELLNSHTISMELDTFGGFFSGKDYNWVVFGQSNPNESDDVEVYRIVKYTKDFSRVGSCSLYGENTYDPFDAGTCRMAEYNENLFIRTCHTMYDVGDGYHHQASVMIEVNQNTLEVTDKFTGIMNSSYGYISHSFDQFINTTDGELTAVDLGDAYPRAVVLMKYPYGADSETFSPSYYNRVQTVNMLTIPEAAGGGYAYNATGVSIGAYEVTQTNYLVAYSSVDQSDAANQVSSTAPRNIYIANLSRYDDFSTENVQTTQITNYTDKNAKTPYIVKISDESYVLMWECEDKVEYTYLNHLGNVVDEIRSFTGSLSECAPIVVDGNVVWYTSTNLNNNGELTFYEISGNEEVFKKVIRENGTSDDTINNGGDDNNGNNTGNDSNNGSQDTPDDNENNNNGNDANDGGNNNGNQGSADNDQNERFTGLALAEDGNWYYYVNGVIDRTYTGMACNEYGWWYVTNGVLDWSYTGMALNEHGWWYMTNGALDWSYTGMALNEYGWWYVTNGALDWSYTGMALNEHGWWYITNGALDWNYTGMALNEYGWWYVTNGALDWSYTGMALNEYGWWYMTNGALDLTYTGTAVNEYGQWQFVNGQLVW